MKRWIIFLALLAAFPPLSTDMYLPAIPNLVRLWDKPLWYINLTLIVFFVTYSFFLLVYGPLSDRWGRRLVLKAGISLYVVASFLCALAPNALTLIVLRMLQAAGAASAASLALALSKDVFGFHEREKVLAAIGVVIALAPMSAPIIGGWTMAIVSWRWIFILLAGFGIVALIGVHRMEETLHPDLRTPQLRLIADYLQLLRNRAYIALVLVVSLAIVPLFAFIAASSEIYISRLGLSEQAYGYFFGFNALALMSGSLVCTRISGKIKSQTILTLCYLGVTLGGVLLVLVPHTSPWSLALPMLAISFSAGLSRPPSNNLVLKQVQQGAGAASSLLMFTLMTAGAIAMGVISLGWEDKITALGIMGSVCGLLGSILWWGLKRKLYIQTAT
ncbi:multidrug effflux MFS transporter [Desulfohalobium retbaense]|uniref:Drug resistance transporter, Bcr/CflA subfamily n=1 Tax=Desulfohalobium retbaense (strain ATCC 49708 / DSM 5692 / JCM 16813 / HR100) TaxID=485915 RepID=C8X1D5_DESRD|nr:multidrug effflux MFS transporter [Desulfohalobium retbaense]ACV68232.1 drug resistance transporter, Bcr/CflA subfamily [Desulfohalobium retbaense DSM 5692]